MTMTSSPPSTTLRRGIVPVCLNDVLWRVTRPDGEVLGYVERIDTPAGARFVAKRLLQRHRRLLSAGEFWSADDALDCFGC